MELQERLKQKFSTLFGYLDERQRRIAAAVEARSLGHGGVTAVALATGMSRPSIHKGLGELTAVSVAPAIANAVYHATGKRIRDLPITIEKLL